MMKRVFIFLAALILTTLLQGQSPEMMSCAIPTLFIGVTPARM